MSVLRLYMPEECGRDGYPSEWHSIEGGPGIKHLVRTEAGDRCVRCGHPYPKGAGEWSTCDERCYHAGPVRFRGTDGSWVDLPNSGTWNIGNSIIRAGDLQARWRILTVHHLTMEKRDCRWWNLASLCQRCHLQIQGKVQMRRVYPLEHSEWFKPYAAGWYAWTYRGVELSRPEVMEMLDELLALERIA